MLNLKSEHGDPMKNVLIIGGGLAGCTAARTLSGFDIPSVILESSPSLGGMVRQFGCKSDSSCSQCGVCAAGNLWDEVERDENITILLDSSLIDLRKEACGFSAYIKSGSDFIEKSFSDIVLANGFLDYASNAKTALDMDRSESILTGMDLERALYRRTASELFAEPPKKVAYVLCFGSRSVKEKANYCSRVCCGYSTRSAKVIRHYYPECEITFFYMDMQTTNALSAFMQDMNEPGIRFIRCRPARITVNGNDPEIIYEDSGVLARETFDKVILCGGIHPNSDNVTLSDLTGLRVDENGFLEYVKPPEKTHVYLAGCVSGPKSIRETVAEARDVGLRIAQISEQDGILA